MAENRTTAAKHEDTTGLVTQKLGADVNDDDEKRREAQRKRNNDIVVTPKFEGDLDELRATGVAKQLLDGNDPDATLIA